MPGGKDTSMSSKIQEYRQAQKALEQEITDALASVIGQKAARQLTRADARKALGALSAFDADAAKVLRHKLAEHEAAFAGIGKAEATARAESIARGLFASRRAAARHGVKLTLPQALRVKVFGSSYRFTVDYERQSVTYAPIKRGERKGKGK